MGPPPWLTKAAGMREEGNRMDPSALASMLSGGGSEDVDAIVRPRKHRDVTKWRSNEAILRNRYR
jgi:hypothetical protein